MHQGTRLPDGLYTWNASVEVTIAGTVFVVVTVIDGFAVVVAATGQVNIRRFATELVPLITSRDAWSVYPTPRITSPARTPVAEIA